MGTEGYYEKEIVHSVQCFFLMLMVSVSGCMQQSKNIGKDYYADDLYMMVPQTAHEKRFPKGHLHKTGDDENKRCYYNKGTSAYFCQDWGDWDE